MAKKYASGEHKREAGRREGKRGKERGENGDKLQTKRAGIEVDRNSSKAKLRRIVRVA